MFHSSRRGAGSPTLLVRHSLKVRVHSPTNSPNKASTSSQGLRSVFKDNCLCSLTISVIKASSSGGAWSSGLARLTNEVFWEPMPIYAHRSQDFRCLSMSDLVNGGSDWLKRIIFFFFFLCLSGIFRPGIFEDINSKLVFLVNTSSMT